MLELSDQCAIRLWSSLVREGYAPVY